MPVVILGILSGTPVEVQADAYLQAIGGNGGGQFRAPCSAGENLTGFELRAGDDVDAIRPVCVVAFGPMEISAPPLTTDSGLVPMAGLGVFGGITNLQQVAPGWHGGPGGGIVQLLCPARTPIVLGIDVQAEGVDTIIVNSIHLFCGQAVVSQAPDALPSSIYDGPKYLRTRAPIGSGRSGASAHNAGGSQRCPAGQVAIGVHGRAGKWLDAMGLICDPPRLTARPTDGRPVVAAQGRVKIGGSSAPSMTICESARLARERNSPAAAGLEAQCRAQTPVVAAQGRVKIGESSGPPISKCEAAGVARDRNSPAAAGLEAQCLALGGQLPPRAGAGSAPTMDELAAAGAVIANDNPQFAELRARQPEGPMRRGFDIAMAAAEGQTAWGPGKQRILDSLGPSEQEGFKNAVSFSLDFNRNAKLAEVGVVSAEVDPLIARARTVEPDLRYRLGFDIATGIFGDPALGARGNTATGPGSLGIRDGLSAPAQRGFNAAVTLHLSRHY